MKKEINPKTKKYSKIITYTILITLILNLFFELLLAVWENDIALILLSPLQMLVTISIAIITIVSFIFFLININQPFEVGFKPFLINIIGLILLFSIPFEKLSMDYHFRSDFAKRMEVIKKIESGEINHRTGPDNHTIMLPKKYRTLSENGEIYICNDSLSTTVIFYETQGLFFSSIQGFLYNSDGLFPKESMAEKHFKNIKKMKENWYYVASY